MKRKLFFMTLLMLFCSVMFGQGTNNWVMDDSPFDENMSLTCQIKINDEFYLDENVTVGAFIEDDLRGVAKPTKDGDRYVVYMTIHGESSDGNSQAITFRLRHPDYEYDMTTTYSLSYVTGKTEGSYDNPIVIDFYPNNWNDLDVKDSCESTMVAFYEISIDGKKQERSNIELAVFCGDELRGWARPSKSDFHNDKYVAAIYIYGNELDNGYEMLSFKLYDSKADKVLETSYQLQFVANEFIGMKSPETIDFRNEAVAQVGNTYYTTLEAAVDAAQDDETIILLQDVTLTKTLTIEKSITIDLSDKKVTGADGAIVFNVKAATTIKNGIVIGNKSGTTSGLIEIYANLDLDGVTIETSKINALRFKAGECTATLTNCNVTGAFKGYGSSVWEIKSGVYKASSTSINEQLNGSASVSGGTFHYEIKETVCAPGYVVMNNGDGIWTVKYAPAAFVDADNDGILDEGEVVYGNLDQIFANHKEGDVHVVLTADIVANAQVDTDADAHYYFTTNVAGGVTMNFLFAEDWNYIQKMTLGQNITLNAKHLLAWTEFNVSGTINTDYLYTTGAKTTITEKGVVNANTGDATVQVKNNATFTVKGRLNTAILNVWVNNAKLIVDGADAKVNASWVDIWDGAPSVTVKNGATLATSEDKGIKASRGGSITVDNATLTGKIELGHNGESAGELTVTGSSNLPPITLTVVGSTVEGPEGLNVTTDVADHKVVYENGVYKVVAKVYVAQVGEVKYESVNEAIKEAGDGATVQLLPGEISEYIAPWANDTQHTTEKSITIIGAENFGTTLTGGLYLGYDDSQCRDHSIIVKGVAFKTKGILVACQKNVTIEGNKFENITDNVASPGSANANAISVIGKNINATVTGNVIDGTASAGINLRDTKTVNVSGNTVTNTVHNSITVQNNTTAEGDIVEIKDNTLSNWGTGGEGRAVRIAGGAEANVNGNVMSCATAPEEYVKVTGSTTLDASANYWNGNSPLSGNYFLSDLAVDPVSILKSYYTDAAKSNLVQLSASVAKIGTTYYQTIADAITAAQPGETVTILAGDYEQNLNINKAITVEGERGDNGEYVVYLKGKVSVSGANITVKNLSVFNGGGNAMGISGGNILVENCELTGANALRSCYANDGDVTLRNCAITGGTYGVHFDAGNGDGDVVIEGCTIKGWTSFGKAIEEVRISNTDFLNGNYNQLRFYQNSQMTNCKFNEEMTIDFGMNDVNAEFEGCAVVDTEGNETDAPLTNVIYLGDIAEMGVDVTINSEPVIVEAKVADNNGDNASYFLVLQEALNAAQANQTVFVISDVELENTLTVAAGKVVTLDLNGKTVSMNDDSAATAALLKNNGNLTIDDSSDEKNGKLTFKSTIPSAANAYASNTISNHGTITILGGTIENTTVGGACYALDNYAGSTATIQGGKLTAEKTTVRIFNWTNGAAYKATLNVSGGEIYSKDGYGININSGNAPYVDLNISGGDITTDDTDYVLAVYVVNKNNAENFNVNITDGTFNGNVAINGTATQTMKPDAVKVTNGTFNGAYGVFSYADNAVAVPVISITGGSFATDYSEAYALDDGYEFVKDETTGRFGLQQLQGLTISTLNELIAFRDAVNAGNDFAGQTVVLSDDVDLAQTRAAENWIPIGTIATPFKGTFDGGNDTISNLNVDGGAYVGLFGYADKATIKNVNIKNANVKGTDCVGVIAGSVYSESTIENCHISGLIQVEGLTKVGGIHGYGYAKIIKSSVVGNNGSYVKGTYNGADKEGDNVGGIVGHGGEGNTISACTVKNISVIGTRKVGGIVGTTDRAKVLDNCLVDGIVIENTAEAAYAGNNVATTTIGGLIGNYHGTGKGGSVINCVVKNVTFNVGNAKNVGPIVGGYRLKPNEEITDVTASGNLIYMSTITGNTTNMYLMNAVAKIGETKYYTLQEAVDAGNGETINVIGNTTEVINIADNAVIDLNFSEGVTLNGYFAPFKANLTINGGTINNTNSGYSAIEINAGTLVLNDVKVTSKRHGVRIDGAVTATINGGEYTLTATSGTRHAVNVSGAANVTIEDGKFEGPAGTSMDSGSAVCVQSGATVTIEGGVFSKGKNHTLSADGTLTVKGGTFDQDPSAYLAPGYVAVKNGNVWTVGLGVAKLNGVTYVSLQAAIDAAVVGDNAIQLLANIDGDVRVSQQEGVNITINGKISDTENYQFNGTVFVDGNSRSTGTETLTIQNINFYTADDSRDFISCNDGGNAVIRYAHNVTVRNCNFTATETSNAVLAMRFRQTYNIRVEGGNFKNLHSVMWATGVTGITVNGIVAENCKEGGLSLGTSTDLKVENVDIEGKLYGIRLGGNNNSTESLGGTLTVTGSKIKAKTPVLARNANSATTFTFNGTNVMTEENDANDYWCIICDGGYNGEETPTYPLGQVTVVLNDTGLSYDGVYGNYGVAKIGDVVYTTFNDAYNAATENNNVITLLADAVVKQTVAKPITINGNEKQLAGNMLVTSDVTFGGKLGLTNNVKVTNGATLTIAEGAEVTGAGTFFGAGSDNNYYGMTNSVTAAGTIKINGNVDIQQINANNAGVVTVAEGAKLTVDIVCAENGDMQNAVAGVMNISGNVETQRFNIFGGSTVNVNATGVVSSEQMFTSSNIEDVISIWGGAKLVVIGTVTCATIEHTDARHSKVNIGADGTLVVDKGGRFTCGGELKNAGELKVVLDCTAEVQSLTGNGKVTVDATYMTASEGLAVKADVTNFNGEITVVGGSYEKTSEGIYVRRTTEFFYTAAGVETTQDQAAYSLMFTITDNANKEVSVKIGSMKPANNSNAHLVIPATVAFNGVNETFKVTAIEDNAFNSCRNFVGDLTLPQYVRTIGDRAFNTCHYITNPEHPKGKLTLNEGLISIGSQAFTNSYFTDGLSIPRSVTMIEPNAFQYAKIKGALTINSDVECALAFNSSEFTKVEIAEGVEEICANAFNGMVNVTEVVLPSTLKEIGLAAFGSDNAIETIWSNAAVAPTILWQSNIESNKHPFTQTVRDNAVVFVTTNYKNYTEAEKWKEFDNIYGLYPIQKTGYSLLVKVNDNVCSVEIGDKPHQNDRIELELPRTIEYYGEVRAVTSIAKGGFKSCPFFGTLTIPGNIETIADNAFNTCMQFNKLVIEEGVKTIGNGSFSMCSGVDYISFPSTLESIGQNAFNVVYMGNGGRIVSFAANPPTAYKHIYNQGINPSFPQNLRNNAILYVFEESLDKYKSATGWEFIDVRPIEAKIGETYYLTLNEAITAAATSGQTGQTITLLADVEAANGTPVTIPEGVTLDINTHNVTANIYGTVKTSGGLWTTVAVPGFNSREMLGDGAIYNTNNATVANSASEVKMLAGSIVLNPNPETEWWTLPNQNLSIASGASFEVPANIKFTVRENTHVVVDGTLTVNGVVYLQMGATVEAAAGLNILTDVEGYMVSYENGVYSVVQAIFTQTTQLGKGWNWFSYYVETDLAELENALGTNGLEIKSSKDGYVRYSSIVHNDQTYYYWQGGLSSISETQMYMINTSAIHTLEVSGNIVDSDQEIVINGGWTWIGYPTDKNVAINDALANLTPQLGDRIKTQDNGYAEYIHNETYNVSYWSGSLATLIPGEGYKYYSKLPLGSTASFKYNIPSDNSKSELRANVTTDNNHWIPSAGQYANNMTMTAMVNVEGNYEIAAFVNGEVRGSARPIYVEALDSYIYFLTIHGDEVEEMSFRLYDLDTDIEYNLSDRMNYSNDAIVGSLTEPYMFNLEMLGIGENSAESFNIYPNPTTTNAEINLNATCDKVEVFNALGVKIAEYSNVDSIDAVETAGIYVIRVTDNGNVQHCRLIVK